MPNNQQPNQEGGQERKLQPGRQDDQRKDQDMRPERDQDQERTRKDQGDRRN